MKKEFTKGDFLVKDLAVSISGGIASTWLPAPDQPTPPSPISPVAAVLSHMDLVQAVRSAIQEAVKTKQFDDVARAFIAGDAGGNPVIRAAIQEIGSAVVASAAFSAAFAEGVVELPDAEDQYYSRSKPPPSLTPMMPMGLMVHSVSELPRLKQQLAETLAYVEKAAEAQAPQGKEVAAVRAELEAALNSLSH